MICFGKSVKTTFSFLGFASTISKANLDDGFSPVLVVCSAPLLPRPSAASAIANLGQMSTHTLPVWDGQPAKMTDRWFSHSVEPILLYQFENTRYKQCGVP